jgi:chemotaxis protein methyltransferase CheR
MMTDLEYAYLKRRIRRLLDFNVDEYRPQQMRRRLEQLVGRRAPGVALFVRALESDPGPLDELRRLLTINVSEFFRDPAQFAVIADQVLPELLDGRSRVEVWSAGCARGQEPYTLAMIADELGAAPRVKILATDIDQEALAHAMAGGPYLPAEVRQLPEQWLQACCTATAEGAFVTDALRRRVDFALHDLLADPYPLGLDLIVCRNVTIYFTPETKQRLVRQFLDSLREGGFLFIGGAEALVGADLAGFQRINGGIYQKSAGRVSERGLQDVPA